jgi:A/G-specific adenine glycosylase
MNKNEIPEKIIHWYDDYGRKNLPWQVENTYYVWVSEIMLQQTQVLKVIEYFNKFITSFPTLIHLAQASLDEVLSHWSGLGYYNRARNIHKTAQICSENYQGQLPTDLNSLIALPGIGRTTAGAILSLALDKPFPILDGNVKRVMSRLFMIKAEKQSQFMNLLWCKVESLMPKENARKYNQALMDIGSMLCKKNKPLCMQCPLIKSCKAQQSGQLDQYPQKNKRPKQVELSLFGLMIIDGDNIYLQKRDELSIWPQLWFLPLFDSHEDLMKKVVEIKLEIFNSFSVTHVLTHRKLDIQVTVLKDCKQTVNQGKWHEISSINSIPHPKALEKIMKFSNIY